MFQRRKAHSHISNFTFLHNTCIDIKASELIATVLHFEHIIVTILVGRPPWRSEETTREYQGIEAGKLRNDGAQHNTSDIHWHAIADGLLGARRREFARKTVSNQACQVTLLRQRKLAWVKCVSTL
jgi:hypothetical protein